MHSDIIVTNIDVDCGATSLSAQRVSFQPAIPGLVGKVPSRRCLCTVLSYKDHCNQTPGQQGFGYRIILRGWYLLGKPIERPRGEEGMIVCAMGQVVLVTYGA